MSTSHINGVDFLTSEICELFQISTKDKNIVHRQIWCMFNLIQYKSSLEGFADEKLCNLIEIEFENHTQREVVISVISRKIIDILKLHIDTIKVSEDEARAQVWELLNLHKSIPIGDFMAIPSVETPQPKNWPYFSHSSMMLKLEKLDEMYNDGSLWEEHSEYGKIFSEKGTLILESIWNGLFCLGTKFPEKMYWQYKHLGEFIKAVKRICAFPGMEQCFKVHDEVRERRKILYELFTTTIEHELSRYTPNNGATLSISAIIIIQMLNNLKETSEIGEPSVMLDLPVDMNKEEIENLKSEIEKLISIK